MSTEQTAPPHHHRALATPALGALLFSFDPNPKFKDYLVRYP